MPQLCLSLSRDAVGRSVLVAVPSHTHLFGCLIALALSFEVHILAKMSYAPALSFLRLNAKHVLLYQNILLNT